MERTARITALFFRKIRCFFPKPAVLAILFALLVMQVWVHDLHSTEVQQEQQSTADHSKFKVLKEKFKTGPDMTKACLSCHTEAAKHIMKTTHWTWEVVTPDG